MHPCREFLRKSAVALMFFLLSIGALGRAEAVDTWSPTGSMSINRYLHTATLLSDGRVLVTGGLVNSFGLPTASAEIYDPATGAWSPTGDMNTIRYEHRATLLSDGRVLVTGGFAFSFVFFLAEIYDPATGVWSLTNSMNTARGGHIASPLSDGRVLVAGGADGQGSLAGAEVYDPATGVWSLTGSMTFGRYLHKPSLLPDGRVLVVGGFNETSLLASTEIYDPVTEAWSLTGSMTFGRYLHMATRLSDGRVLTAGGKSDTNSGTFAEIYDPATEAWSLTGLMSTGRFEAVATLLSDGRVLAAGGWNFEQGFLASAEIYDAATEAWSLASSMSTARFGYTATLLSDGRVLVAGGADGPNPLAGAELFGPDATPPQVSCGAPDGAWHNTDVTIACTASDPESGLASPADAAFSLTTDTPVGTETANAATTSRQVCNNEGGCTTAGPISGNKVDKKPPTITIASPAANATYQLNASVGALYACADGGSGVALCQGLVSNGSPINTSSTGTKTFTIASTDTVGNPATLSVTYNVVSGGGGGATSADVGITLSAPSKISPGEMLTYSMTVTNAGRATAANVVVSDAIPGGTLFASASASQGAVTAPAVGSTGNVMVNLGSLAKGATATISVVVTVTAESGTVLSNTAIVSATTQDLDSGNNSATQKTTVTKK